jgi:hypothetical protein
VTSHADAEAYLEEMNTEVLVLAEAVQLST